MKAGDKIRIDWYALGYWDGVEDYIVEEYRWSLGIFKNEECRVMGRFTPLCELYYDGPETTREYMPNCGEYRTNLVPAWANLP